MEDTDTEVIENTEPADAAPAETPETPAAPEAASEEGTEETVVAEEIESPSAEEEVEAPSSTPPDAAPSAEGFGWGDWDGENLEAFPEDVRPWIEGLLGHKQAEWAERDAAIQESRELYYNLITQNQDPRVSDFESKVGELEKQIADLEAAKESMTKEHTVQVEQLQAQFEGQIKEFNKRIADEFEKEHQDIFTDDVKAAQFVDLVMDPDDGGEGWDYRVVPALMKLPLGAQAYAAELRKKGANDQLAVELAQRDAHLTPPEEKKSSNLVGAGNVRGNRTEFETNDMANPEERKLAAIRKAANAFGGFQ